MSFLIVFSTAPSLREARRIADSLLKKRLAACVSISGPVESRFWWKGKLGKAKEYRITIKTLRAAYSRVEKALKKEHSYECPEVIALPVTRGSRAYLKWLAAEARG